MKLNRFFKDFFCFWIVFKFIEYDPKVIISFKVIGIDIDGFFIMGDGFLIVFLFFESVPKIIMSFCKVWLYINRIFEVFLSFFILLKVGKDIA